MALALAGALRKTSFGLATALAYAVSPVFVRLGVAEGTSVETGLAIGLTAAAGAYLVTLFVTNRGAFDLRGLPGWRPVAWEVAAALTIVTGTWLRYRAMNLLPLAIVSTLGRISIPVILIIERRRATVRIWIGCALIVGGTVLIGLT